MSLFHGFERRGILGICSSGTRQRRYWGQGRITNFSVFDFTKGTFLAASRRWSAAAPAAERTSEGADRTGTTGEAGGAARGGTAVADGADAEGLEVARSRDMAALAPGRDVAAGGWGVAPRDEDGLALQEWDVGWRCVGQKRWSHCYRVSVVAPT